MHRIAPTSRHDRSTLRRVAGPLLAVAAAALVAAGCADGGAGGSEAAGASGIVGDEGPLAWLPAETWLVASGRLNPAQIDTAIETLDRLPAWTLVESFLPADDGKGLRRELLQEFARSASSSEDSDTRVTAKQLEAAFGERVGLAIYGNDFEQLDGKEPPLVAWVEVDDPDAAEDVARELATGTVDERTHEGVDYLVSSKEETAMVIGDELLLFAPSESGLRQVIEAHEGGDTLADDATARAVIEGGIGEAMIGAAVQTDPLLESVPSLLRSSARETEDVQEREQLERIASDLGPVLESAAVGDLVADWVSTSVTVDETGLRVRGAWSNPRELADPDVGSRELVERMPAAVPVASAFVSDGSAIGRAQDARKEVREAYDLDLRELAAQCEPADRWACTLGAELAVALLEDETLAEAARDAGATSTAYVQDLSSLLALAASAEGGRPSTATGRLFEVATTARPTEWKPSSELVAAAAQAGILLTSTERSITIRVRPASPAGRGLARATAEDGAALTALGIDVAALTSTAGLTFTLDEVDGIQVAGMPDAAPSKVVPALEGEVETLGDSETYQQVVGAAKPPREVGVYGFVDLRGYVESIFGVLAAQDQQMRRVLPTVRNNLADAPGIVMWSGRTEVDGKDVGIGEYALPILE